MRAMSLSTSGCRTTLNWAIVAAHCQYPFEDPREISRGVTADTGTIAMWPLADDECCVSIDSEADGPARGLNSILSLGATTFTGEDTLTDTFSANLEVLPEA